MKDEIIIKLRAQNAPWRACVEFLLLNYRTEEVATVFKWQKEDEAIQKNEQRPTFSLTQGAAQILMDDLWNCGLRPTEGTGSAGSLAATQKHLEDMRTLVFKK